MQLHTKTEMVTNWDVYHLNPYRSAAITRRITARYLISRIKESLPFVGSESQAISVAELGGANSCFLEQLFKAFHIREYAIIDRNRVGLDASRSRWSKETKIKYYEDDILQPSINMEADFVFSVGLIEHFDEEGTANAIRNHFKFLRPGGLLILSYPTPTFLYRAIRSVAEISGKWIFHDERPLKLQEIEEFLEERGDILNSCVIWPILLTQQMVTVRKRY